MKKVVALLTAVCLSITPVAVFAEDTDYSYLEDMTVKEIRQLNDIVNNLLSGKEFTTDIDIDEYENMSVKELKSLQNAIKQVLGIEAETTKETNESNKDTVEGLYIGSAGYDETHTYEFTADNSEKTQGSYKDTENGSIYTGDYRINADLVMLNGQYNNHVFTKYGDYLVDTESAYTGIIPETEFFEVYIYDEYDGYPTLNDKDEYNFFEDGTFKWKRITTFYANNITEFKDDVRITDDSGTYKMIDNILLCTFDDGRISAFYIINGIPCSYVYKKAN